MVGPDGAYPRAMRAARCLAPLIAAALLAACAAFRPEPPEVRLADVAIERFGLFEQTYRVGLRLRNPNERDLAIDSLTFDLALAGRAFADGVSADGFEIPAGGEERVELEVRSDLSRVLDVLQAFAAGERDLPYRLEGEARLGGWGITVPFEREGRLELPSS